MSFDWLEYLKVAQDLVNLTSGSSSQEARWRTAISRSYYAAFITARNLLRDKDHYPIPRRGVHQRVIDMFKNSTDKSRRRIGYALESLRNDRHLVDYEDTVPNLPYLTRKAIVQARQIIADLDHL